MSKTAQPTFTLPRALHEGAHGLDVVGTKRALSRAGFIAWPAHGERGFTPYYGPYMVDAVNAYAKANHLLQGHGYTAQLHKQLLQTHAHGKPTEWAFDSLAISLEAQETRLLSVTPDQRVRAAILSAGFYWYAHRMAFGYAEARPFELCKPPEVPPEWDCSAYFTNCHYAGGAPNPNGLSNGQPRPWDGQGYTGTLMARGTRCTLADLEVGDAVFFGFYSGPPSPAFPPGSPTHVAMFAGYSGHVPMLLSNGSYPMGYVPLTYRGDVNHFRHYNVV